MALIRKFWYDWTEADWDRLAREWLSCVRDHEGRVDDSCDSLSEITVGLGLWGPPDLKWNFIKRTLSLAETEGELSAIVAGPLEFLLGKDGEEYISAVEEEAKENTKLIQSLAMCNRYLMSDDVWERVTKLQHREV